MPTQILKLSDKLFTTNVNLNVSSIVSNISSYQPGTAVTCNPFYLDDIQMCFKLYPNGPVKRQDGRNNGNEPKTTSAKSVGIFLNVLNFAQHKSNARPLKITLIGDAVVRYCVTKTVSQFSPGYGWTSCITHAHLRTNPIIEISVQLFSGSTSAQSVNEAEVNALDFERQHCLMHELSQEQENGDIQLVVVQPSDSLGEPRPKRRKLNRGGIYYNSVVLRSASPVFHRMLGSDMAEKKEKTVKIEAASEKDVLDMLYFMSTNKLAPDCNHLNLLKLAHYYEMSRMLKQCASQLIKSLTVESFAGTLNAFEMFKIREQYMVLVDFAKQNANILKDRDEFHDISFAVQSIILNEQT